MTVFAALVVLSDRLPNDSDIGDNVTAETPVPVSCSVCGEFEASSLTVSVPVRDPVTAGVKVTEIVQLALGGNAFGDSGQFEVSAKSPEVEMPAIVRATV